MGMQRGRLLLLVLVVVTIGAGAVMATSWVIVDTVIHSTSDHEFCSNCHSHGPIGSSYRESMHGGNNSSGWRASCSDCHIPQDNALHYLWVKGIHGVIDPTMEILKDSYDIDWHANRKRRQEYTYDSGCLSCHKYLKETSEGNRKAFLGHRRYFKDPKADGMSCVKCHKQVGHANLGNHLEAMGWHKNEGEQP